MNKSEKKSGSSGPDRRVQKTKKLLSDALVALILEKGYDDVSIGEILERANVGRSTFYAHYENKEQLLLYGHEHLRNLAIRDGADHIDFLSFYRHLAERYDLAQRLLASERGAAVITRSLQDILHTGILRLPLVPPRGPSERAMTVLRADAAAAALVRLMVGWVRGGMPYPPEVMAEESTQILTRLAT